MDLTSYYKPEVTKNLLTHYRDSDDDALPELSLLEAALTQLHRQGLVLYYPNIAKDKVWLNPMAFVEYVHKEVLNLDKLEQLKGRIPVELFNKQKIEPDVLKILLQEKVIFLHQYGGDEGTQQEYIVPNYLPLTNENSAEYKLCTFGLGEKPALILWFEKYLPLGLINQLICHFGNLPDSKKFWRNQLLFTLGARESEEQQNKTSASQVLIKLEFEDQLQIKIYLHNSDPLKWDEHLGYIYYIILSMYFEAKEQPSPQLQLTEFTYLFKIFKKYKEIPDGMISDKDLSVDLGLPSVATAPQQSKPQAPKFLPASKKREFRMPGDFITDIVKKASPPLPKKSKVVKLKYRNTEFSKIYQKPPADLQLSVNGVDFISAAALAKIEHETSLPAKNLKKQSSGIHMLPVTPFEAFTINKLNKMLKVFISYSHQDIDARRELQSYLVNLEREGIIEIWQDGLINTGDNWDKSIKQALEQADVILMLVSQAFIASSYVHSVEMPKAMDLKRDGKARILPVLLKTCDFANWWIMPKEVREREPQQDNQKECMGWYQFSPMADGYLKPVNKWPYVEDAWTEVAKQLRALSASS